MKDTFDSNRLNYFSWRKAVGFPNCTVGPISEVLYRQMLLSVEDSKCKSADRKGASQLQKGQGTAANANSGSSIITARLMLERVVGGKFPLHHIVLYQCHKSLRLSFPRERALKRIVWKRM